MTVYLPSGLPAVVALRAEGLAVASEPPVADRGVTARPLTIALINLMPDKPTTEIQFARLLAGGRRSVRLLLTVPDNYHPSPRSHDHVKAFYRPWSALPHARIDAAIVTGAPLEKLAFEEVRYWPELTRIFDWIEAARLPTVYVCWAAQAALMHHHGVPKHVLGAKRFGIYPHIPPGRPHPLLRGVPLPFAMPVSQHAEARIADLASHADLQPVLVAPVAGAGIVADDQRRAIYCLNHPEYDADALDREARRDRDLGQPNGKPVNYYHDGAVPSAHWHPAARVFYRNWLESVADCDPCQSPDAALEWLIEAEVSGMARCASGQDQPH